MDDSAEGEATDVSAEAAAANAVDVEEGEASPPASSSSLSYVAFDESVGLLPPTPPVPSSSSTADDREDSSSSSSHYQRLRRQVYLPPLSAPCLPFAEVLLVEIGLRNRDRAARVWPLLSEHYRRRLLPHRNQTTMTSNLGVVGGVGGVRKKRRSSRGGAGAGVGPGSSMGGPALVSFSVEKAATGLLRLAALGCGALSVFIVFFQV